MDWHIYLSKASHNLRTAQLAYDHDDFDSCVSRAYFAVFQIEIASLLKFTSFRQVRWGHDRVQAEFNRRLIRDQKVFSASLRFIHNDLIGRRHTADYSAQHVSARAAERCLRKATEMVSSIAEVLEQS
ncbi:MAG: HEPN domain-containing protein [Candidatus Tectomicrobia bacterium]|nr:HEPN domain-containing protein [Candidatus Tectomicrobia bacterium]